MNLKIASIIGLVCSVFFAVSSLLVAIRFDVENIQTIFSVSGLALAVSLVYFFISLNLKRSREVIVNEQS